MINLDGPLHLHPARLAPMSRYHHTVACFVQRRLSPQPYIVVRSRGLRRYPASSTRIAVVAYGPRHTFSTRNVRWTSNFTENKSTGAVESLNESTATTLPSTAQNDPTSNEPFDDDAPWELTLVDAPTEDERLAARAAAAAERIRTTTTVKVLFCFSKFEVLPGAVIHDGDGPSTVSLLEMEDIQRHAQEFYQDWDTPHEAIQLDYYTGTEWTYLHDISLLEPYKMQKKPVPVRNQRFFDDPDIMTLPYRQCV